MSLEFLTIGVLILIFLIGTIRNINLGVLGLVGAFIVALFVPAYTESGDVFSQVFSGFPVSLMMALMGLTYLFGFAQSNGTIDIILEWSMKAVRGNRALMPWIFFLITGAFMSIGAIFCIGVISPLAIPFARRYRINQLMMGMMVVHGGMAGLLSPLSVYGIYVNNFLADNGLGNHQSALFCTALVFNVIMGLIVYCFLGGLKLLRGRDAPDPEGGEPGEPDSGGATRTRAETRIEGATASGITFFQWLTLIGLAVLVIGAGVFAIDIGVLSLIIGACLAIYRPEASKKALNDVSWSTIVLVGGMVTYIEVLEAAGTVEFISGGIAALGAPMIGLLLLCYMSGIVSALASSIATIGIAISMASPFLLSGDLPIVGTAAAIAIAATVVDVSPFSTNGAMVLANVDAGHRDRFFRQMLIYSGVVVALGPLLAWSLVLLPI
ncbi:SLC13 family permease [Corynebacterium pacaense]|uniref:SLC13 family permease n=1 Tax=Corynebacterium pacaense TaxID=1816684 RepID=UPI0009BC33CB|nr:SLC13 family permease [Corynebacterium pacaense]